MDLYALISLFLHHPIGIVPGFKPPVAHLPIQ